jgi:hypothetical protein
MEFINKGESIKLRIGDLKDFQWATIKTGQIIDLPENVGLANKFERVKVTEGKIADTKVETKQLEVQYTPDNEFFKELTKIKGIGKKTADDIVTWGTREKLIEQIQLNAELPFRDDVVEKLRVHYGKVM